MPKNGFNFLSKALKRAKTRYVWSTLRSCFQKFRAISFASSKRAHAVLHLRRRFFLSFHFPFSPSPFFCFGCIRSVFCTLIQRPFLLSTCVCAWKFAGSPGSSGVICCFNLMLVEIEIESLCGKFFFRSLFLRCNWKGV